MIWIAIRLFFLVLKRAIDEINIMNMRERYFHFVYLIFAGLLGFVSSLNAQTFNGQGNLPVPPGAPSETVGITTSIATVSGIGILGEGCSYVENVTLDFTHTWVGDVAIFIIAPSGEVLELSSSNGSSGDDYQVTVFTDNTTQFITEGMPPYDGTFRPEGRQTNTVPPFPDTNPLGTYTFDNTFAGVNADGDWTLMINDFVLLDVGTIHAWSITFATGGGPAPVVDLGPDITICPGQSAILTADVDPAADSYLWSTGETTESITVSPNVNTIYSVTVTNNDCIDSDTIEVIVNPNGVTANAGNDVSICSGNSATLTGSGGSAGATYNWSSGQTGATITVNPVVTTTYTLTVTDGGCSDTDQVVVTVTPTPNANAGADVAICEGGSATLTASGGTQNNHYLWSTGQTGSTIVVNPASTTTYTVTVTVNGCSDSDDVLVTVNEVPTVNAGPDVQICAGESTTLTASGSDGTYQWSTGQSGAQITVSPNTTTTYTVTATENGCTATDQVVVTVGEITADVTPDQSICEGASVTLTASGGSTFSWSTGETTASIVVTPSTTTTYTVTVSQGSCSDEASVTITVDPIPVANVSPDEEICAGESVTLTASGGTTYAWSNGQSGSSITVSPVNTTLYTVTVSTGGCSATASVEVAVNPTPNAFAGSDESICEGESVTLTASGLPGPGTYEWNTGETTSTITVTPTTTTTYTVTITNEWDCSDSDDVTVTVNSTPVANAGVDVEICEGESATLTASGGSGPSSYQWSTGQSGATILVMPSVTTTYTVTITEGACIDEDDVTVIVNSAPVASAGADQSICSGEAIQLTATGGDTYLWSTGENTSSIEVAPIATTIYSVTVTDITGCTDEDNVMVTVNPNPIANAGADQVICDGESATLTASGGGTYSWSNGMNTPSISVSPSSTTSYQLTVTDSNGCTDVDIVTVVVNPNPLANAGTNAFITPGESVTLTATGGGTYMWSTGETTAQISVSPIVTTTYTVTVTLNGCTDVDEVTVFVNEAPSVDLGPDQVICEGETATLDATISGSFVLEYNWSTGESAPIIQVSPIRDSVYSVTVTDMNTGSSSIDSISVTVIHLPVGEPVIQGPGALCAGGTGTYTVNVVEGASNYDWSVPSGATIISGQGTTSIEVDWGTSTGGQIQLIVSNDCGELPSVAFDFITLSVPMLTGPINGDMNPCADGSAQYSIPPVTGSTGYQWSLSGSGTIMAGQGTPNITVAWNSSAGGDLCVVAMNICGSSNPLCQSIATTTTPVLNAGPDKDTCGLTGFLSATGTGMWSLITGAGSATIEATNLPSTLVHVTKPGLYQFNYSISQNGCVAGDTVNLNFFDSPRVENIATECDQTNTEYTVSFVISGGLPPYQVNGELIAGNQYFSAAISSGDPYSFLIVDANGCAAPQVTGQTLCTCSKSAGTMDTSLIEVCVDATVSAVYQGGEVLEPNDAIAFILHDGNIPGGIISWNNDPEFGFLPQMSTGITYFISAVVGIAGGNGLPLLNDPCLSISEGTPVVFHGMPEITVAGDTTVCEGNCTSLRLTVSGVDEVDIEYSDGATVLVFSALPGEIEIPVCPETTTDFIILRVSDKFCSVDLADTIHIDVRENLSAGTSAELSYCEGSEEVIDLFNALTGPDSGGNWAEVSAMPSLPGTFDPLNAMFSIKDQVPGLYSFEYRIPGLDGCPADTSTVNIFIDELPVANAGPDVQIDCHSTMTGLDASGSSQSAEIMYQWSTIGGQIQGPADAILIQVIESGLYFLSVTNIETGCVSMDTVRVDKVSLPEVDLGPDLQILPGQSVTLTAQVSIDSALSYNWFDASACADCNAIVVSPEVSTTYYVEVMNDDLCTAIDSITVTVSSIQEVFVPTAFSPNGDGVNDELVVFGAASLSLIHSFEIFDRWGSKVFEAHNFLPGDQAGSWDGTLKGNPLGPGVYVYLLEAEFGADILQFRGDITLIR